MAGRVLNDKYLPFTREELRDHFAPVGKAPDDRHLHYFENSLRPPQVGKRSLLRFTSLRLGRSGGGGRLAGALVWR